ncbi:MAG TPA: HD domain-containing protein [Bacteroidales bacterium]|nr:HD domain-containing protein [Bacteroidales bacterium]
MYAYPEEIISKTTDFVKSKSLGESSGHDWWHIYRVHKLAVYIAKQEKADLYIVELAALLHDLDDWKFNAPGSAHAADWLAQCGLETETVQKITSVIGQVSFKGAGEKNMAVTLEAKVVQDADRLDAIGAIGIARAFAYGGYNKSELYNPDEMPALHENFEAYKKSRSHTINHFYEKLLLLKDRLYTETAKKLSEKRHQFLEDFLSQFYAEWNFNPDYEIETK